MPSVSSTLAPQVDAAFWFIVGISVFLLALITFFMVFFVIRYSRRRNPVPTDIEGNIWLEIAWTVVPVVIVLAMFQFGYTGYAAMRNVPKGAMEVKVSAMMWRWSFTYANGVQSDELRVPLDKPVKVLLTSLDVLHSFYVPAFRVKRDVVPGQEHYLWFQPTTLGEFDVLCAEYCGTDHSQMLSKVVVLPPEEFDAWYKRQGEQLAKSAPAPAAASAPADSDQPTDQLALGKRLMDQKGCFACHSRDGTKLSGPTFKGLFGRKVTVTVGDQEKDVVADEDYVKRSVATPESEIVKGFQPLMPPPNLTDDELEAVVAYLKTLN